MAHVALGVSASVAIHRALDLTSALRKEGHRVSVVMTPSAKRLVSPALFQAVSLSRVYHDMWEASEAMDHDHVRLGSEADVLVVAPATANTMAKLALGSGDDLVATTALAFEGPRLFAPAMNHRMWRNQAVRRNCRRLTEDGWELIEPEFGDLASLTAGEGRMAAVDTVLERIRARLP